MHAEWSVTEGEINNINDTLSHAGWIGIFGNDCGECLLHLFTEILVWTGFVFREAGLIRWSPRVREMVRALSKGSGNDDGRLDAPAAELASVEYS